MSDNLNALLVHSRERLARQFPVVHFFKPETFRDVPIGTVITPSVWSKLRYARWITVPATHYCDGLTYADLARSWMEIYCELPLRRKRDDQPIQYAPIPHMAQIGMYRNVAYVDIKSTYRSIIEICGFDVEYRAMRWISRGKATQGLEYLDKRIYASIVTLSAKYYRSYLETTKDGSLKPRKVRNKYANVCLYALVRDVLHCVYSEIVESIPVLYANTDGYIVELRDVENVGEILDSWGFAYGIKRQGDVEISGTSEYAFNDDIGRKRKRYSRSLRKTPLADEKFRKWLKERWQYLARARDAERNN